MIIKEVLLYFSDEVKMSIIGFTRSQIFLFTKLIRKYLNLS